MGTILKCRVFLLKAVLYLWDRGSFKHTYFPEASKSIRRNNAIKGFQSCRKQFSTSSENPVTKLGRIKQRFIGLKKWASCKEGVMKNMCIQQNQDKFHTLHNLGKINSKFKLDYVYACVSICVFVCMWDQPCLSHLLHIWFFLSGVLFIIICTGWTILWEPW